MERVIFLDFDDSLFYTKRAVISFLNSHYRIEIPEEGFHCGNRLEELVNSHLPEDKKVERMEFYMHYAENFLTCPKKHSSVTPIEGVQEAIAKLSEEFSLWVVTARQSMSGPVVEYLIDKFLKDYISGVHYVWQTRRGEEPRSISKKSFIENFQGEKIAFIDDNPEEIRDVQDVVESYLFDPNNHHPNSKGVRNRVQSWEEVVSLIL